MPPFTATRGVSFEQMGVPTRPVDYGLDGSTIPALLAKLVGRMVQIWG